MTSSRVALQTKIANGTKRAEKTWSDRCVVYAKACYALRSDACSKLWKCTAMARQMIVHANTAATDKTLCQVPMHATTS